MSTLTSTGHLVRLALRRDRVVIPVVAVAAAVMAGFSAKAVYDLYPSGTAMEGLVATYANPATRAIYGLLPSPATLDTIATFEISTLGALACAVLAYGLVRRHTRTDEEAGRLELLGATVMGRLAPLTAALVVALGAVLLTTLLGVAAILWGGVPAGRGTIAFALYWLGPGLVWAGIGAVAAQVSETSRGAGGISLALLGVAFLARAIGSLSTSLNWLLWLTPFGWSDKLSVHGANRLWPFAISLAVGAALITLAYVLQARRDHGSGLIQPAPGPPRAAASLTGPFGLVWRSVRPSLLGWSIAFAILGVGLGTLRTSVDDMLSDPTIRDLVTQMAGGQVDSLVNLYFSVMLTMVGLVAAAFCLTTVLRLHSAEEAGHAELLLSTAASRTRFFLAHLVPAVIGTLILLVVFGVAIGTSASMIDGDWSWLPKLVLASLAQLPALLLVLAVGALAMGVHSDLAPFVWAYYALVAVLSWMGAALRLPQWIIDLSPFAHSPQLPGGEAGWTSMAVMLAIALALALAGWWRYTRRDVG